MSFLEKGVHMKKILCLLLSVCLVFSVVSFGASALETNETKPETDYIYLGSVDAVAFDPTTKMEATQNGISAIPFYSNGTAQPFTFYAQLNANQKAVYDTILQNPLQTQYRIALAEPLTYVLPTSTNNMPQETADTLMATAIGGLSALMDDHPEIFWVGGFNVSYSISRFTNADGTYTFQISTLTLEMNLNQTAYSSWAEVFSAYHEMLAAIDAFPVRGFTRYEKLKSIHDNIARQVVYDPNLGGAGENPTDHEPTSVFLEPFTTVCEGYAEAFQLLCQREGIPCITVVGTADGGGHAWNYVQMEDGVWYAVDLTWDDQGDVLYDFFLVGADAPNVYFGGGSFESEHVNTGRRFTSDLFTLSYPTLSDTSYCGILLNANTTASFSREKGMLFLQKNDTVETAFTAPQDWSLTATGWTTGDTLSYSGSQGSGTYTLVRRGDINADNVANSTDYAMVKETLSGTRDLAAGSAYEAAGDMNGDGVVDAFDAALLDLYLNDIPVY